MRVFAILLASAALALSVTAALAPKPGVVKRAVAQTVQPVGSIGDIFRGH
jgi:hypothetical protein